MRKAAVLLAAFLNIARAALADPAPIPFYDLPTIVPGSSFTAHPFDVEAIRNTMAHYPLCIDGKNFEALDLVFAPDAVANYSAPLNVLTPLSTIKTVLENALIKVNTQHALSTQVIDVISPTEAFSVTYYTATHFGVGNYEGQILVAYGQYQDAWVRQPDLSWKISHRNLVYMGPGIGNFSIFS
ncbi:hypothetical protein B0O99DRAFT_359756 [Bisporella sp. PMI_857]|nr:hypothetical protein B0O99DRAFT_359756 [Bisporella sp. PMI_857]